VERKVDQQRRTTNDKTTDISIVAYDPRYDDDFRRLNYEWLEEFFEVEPYDRIVRSNPQKRIIGQGGSVFFALKGDEVVGTCALLKHTDHKYEMAKLGVTRSCQGLGIGRQLVQVSIEQAIQLKATVLVLATSKLLVTANRLYESLGFRYVDLAELGPLPYQRETVAMALRLELQPRQAR